MSNVVPVVYTSETYSPLIVKLRGFKLLYTTKTLIVFQIRFVASGTAAEFNVYILLKCKAARRPFFFIWFKIECL